MNPEEKFPVVKAPARRKLQPKTLSSPWPPWAIPSFPGCHPQESQQLSHKLSEHRKCQSIFPTLYPRSRCPGQKGEKVMAAEAAAWTRQALLTVGTAFFKVF
jgi:hypothetical protein